MWGRGKTYLGLQGIKLNYAITFFAGCSFLLFGYDQGVLSSLLTLPSFLEVLPELEANDLHGSVIQGLCVGIYEIGCLIGALTTSYSGDIVGRRKNIFMGAIIMTVGAILQASTFGLPQFIVARVVTGIGNGFITATVPMWQAECAKPHERGRLVITSGALITFGIMISYWIDYGFSFAKGQIQWRFPIAFQIVFALVIIAFVLELPESPRWLVSNGDFEEAHRVFAALDGLEVDDPLVQRQIDEVRASLVQEDDQQTGYKAVFTFGSKKRFHRFMLALTNQAQQQISGINLLTYYMGTLLQTSIGLDSNISGLIAACNGTEYFLASLIPFWTIERFGRRPLMLFGAAGQVACMAILTGTVYDGTENDNLASSITAVVFLFGFNTFFAIGWLGMTWLYPAEITPLEIRAVSNACSTASNWIFNFAVVMLTPILFERIAHYTYLVFAIINCLIFVATYFFLPETAGRSLEEIDEIFAKSNSRTPWDVVWIAAKEPKLGHLHDGTLTQVHDPEKGSNEHFDHTREREDDTTPVQEKQVSSHSESA